MLRWQTMLLLPVAVDLITGVSLADITRRSNRCLCAVVVAVDLITGVLCWHRQRELVDLTPSLFLSRSMSSQAFRWRRLHLVVRPQLRLCSSRCRRDGLAFSLVLDDTRRSNRCLCSSCFCRFNHRHLTCSDIFSCAFGSN